MIKRGIFLLIFLVTMGQAQYVFLFGDSMAEAIAQPLEKHFLQTSHAYGYMFKRGTTLNYWIHNPDLFVSLHMRKPDFVVISLGTNDIVAKKTNEEMIAGFETLLEYLQKMGVPRENVLLVAPPIPNDNDLNLALYDRYGAQVFLSKNMQLTLKKDKIHPTMEADATWGYAVYTVITSFMSRSISTLP